MILIHILILPLIIFLVTDQEVINFAFSQFDDGTGTGGGFDNSQQQQQQGGFNNQQPMQQFPQQQFQQQPYFQSPTMPYQQQPFYGPQNPYQQYPNQNNNGGGIDMNTVIAIISALLGSGGTYVKARKDMSKNKEETKEETASAIQNMLLPLFKQNATVVSQTAKQDVKIKEALDLIYKTMGDDANKIEGMSAIKQQELIKDMVASQLAAKSYQEQIKKLENKEVPTTTVQNIDQPTDPNNPFG